MDLKQLVRQANELDKLGKHKEADQLDRQIRRYALISVPDKETALRKYPGLIVFLAGKIQDMVKNIDPEIVEQKTLNRFANVEDELGNIRDELAHLKPNSMEEDLDSLFNSY